MFLVGTQGTWPAYHGSSLPAAPVREVPVAVGGVCESGENNYGRGGIGFKFCPLSPNFLL